MSKEIFYDDSLARNLHTPSPFKDAINDEREAQNFEDTCDVELEAIKGLNVYHLVVTPIDPKHVSTSWYFKVK